MHKMSQPTDRTESIRAEWINIYSYRLSLTLIQSLSFRNGKCITPYHADERLYEYFLTQMRLDLMCALAPNQNEIISAISIVFIEWISCPLIWFLLIWIAIAKLSLATLNYRFNQIFLDFWWFFWISHLSKSTRFYKREREKKWHSTCFKPNTKLSSNYDQKFKFHIFLEWCQPSFRKNKTYDMKQKIKIAI